MPSQGSFAIPYYAHQSTHAARAAYRAAFDAEWPHDDGYLRTLAKELDARWRRGRAGKCAAFVRLMREKSGAAATGE
jgi:hypothetical protein